MRFRFVFLLTLFAITLTSTAIAQQDEQPEVPVFATQIVAEYPHDTNALTMGLLWHDGSLYESTGIAGASSLRRTSVTGENEATRLVDAQYFATGLTLVGDTLIQLTLRDGIAFTYDVASLENTGSFAYEGDAIGLCYDGEALYMSDGTETIYRRDPETFEVLETFTVNLNGENLAGVAELECVGEHIFANVLQRRFILRIDKNSGSVDGLINAALLLPGIGSGENNFLSGIAYNPDSDTFYLTGTLSPTLYEVRFVEAPAAARLGVEVLETYAHDSAAFTQGLLLHEGLFYESTGRRGQSTLREVQPETGEVLRSISIDEAYFGADAANLANDELLFGEGLALVDNRLIQITWTSGLALVYDRDTFALLETFNYEGQGWGICYDGETLYMSDGSPYIYLRDPATFEQLSRITVTVQGDPVLDLNELECVGDYIYANVWQQDVIVRIDKATGFVDQIIDASGLLTEDEVAEANVLNGIAYAENDQFYITGKLWPKMFLVRFVEP